MGGEALLQHEGRLSAIRHKGDNAIVIFGGAGARSVQDWAHNMTDIDVQEISMRSQSYSRLNQKYLWFVPSRRASLDVGTDIKPTICAQFG